MAEIASYTYALNESAYITKVTLSTITTHPITTEERMIIDNILPRYEANFQLQINRDAFSVKEDQ